MVAEAPPLAAARRAAASGATVHGRPTQMGGGADLCWLGRYRRLSRDYEDLPATSEAAIQLAVIQLLGGLPEVLHVTLRQPGCTVLRGGRQRLRGAASPEEGVDLAEAPFRSLRLPAVTPPAVRA